LVRRRTQRSGEPRSGVGATAIRSTKGPVPPNEPTPTEAHQRRCIATGAFGERAHLLRFVLAPDGEIIPDVSARLPGRGFWLTPRREVVEQALARRSFARAARRPVTAPAGLADRIEALLVRHCRDGIALARRAGAAVAGFEKVREALRGGKTGLVLSALDGAEGSQQKLRALARGVPLARVLTAAEIGAAFGRDHVVNAAIENCGLCARILVDAEKIAGFRAGAAVDRGMEPAPAGTARPDRGIGSK
jgi:predicted RNA-binding protein YlxR (DUF448 family)/ribosomal protein L7Ae-like RNA K-turn-binding protein